MKKRIQLQIILSLILISSILGILLLSTHQINEKKVDIDTIEMINFKKSEFSFNQLPHINVTLFSESINNSNHLLIAGNPGSPSTSAEIAMKLPSPPQHDQWLGWNTSIRIYNLLDNRTWNENADFSSGSNDGPPSVDQEDGVSYFHNDTITNWVPDYYEDPTSYYNDMTLEYDETNNYVNITYYANKSGNFYGYNVGEYVGIRQDGIDVFRGAITNAWLRIIYDPVYFCNISTTPLFDFSARINEERVYQKTSVDLLGVGLLDTGWLHSSLWQNATPVFPPPSANGYSDFNLSLRVSYIQSYDFNGYGWPEDLIEYQRVQVHAVYLAIEARAQPNSTDIQLEVNNRAINGTFGDGNIQWVDSYPNSISNDPYNLLFNSSSPDNNIDLSFDVDVNFQVFKFKGTTKTQSINDLGVQFSVDRVSNKIKYQYYLYAYWDFSDFFNFYFNYSIPRDWNISLVQNPALAVIYNRTAGYNLGILGGDASDGYVLIPTRNGTGDPVAELPGWWYFEAEGPNYINTMEIEKKVGLSWISSTTFNSTGLYDGDLLRVKATINNETGVPPDIQNSLAYLKVLLPNGTTLITRENNTINVASGEVTFEPFILAGVNTTGGIFQAQVYWNHSYDYLSGYEKVITPESYYFGAGYDQMDFTVIHDSNLKIINPLDAQADSEADLNYFDIFTLKMFLNDTDSNVPIPESSVIINWSGILPLTESAGGLYSASLDTTDLGNPGIYYIRINSSKSGFYDATTLLKLNVIAESILEPLNTPPPDEFGNNFSVQMFYYMPGNANYNYSGAIVNVSTGPTSGYLIENIDYTYTDLLNGTYEFTIFTGEFKTLNESGQTSLYIHTAKPFIENATKEITLFINPTSTELVTNKSIFVAGFYETVIMFVNYTVEADGSPVIGATISVSGHGSLPYFINQIGNGVYAVEFNSSSTVNIYDIVITASKTGWVQKSVNFLLSVDAKESVLENIAGAAPITLSENATLLMFYYKPGEPTQNYTGAMIEVSLDLATNYLVENVDYLYFGFSNGTYALTLYTGDGTNFNETGQHSIYVHASRLYVKNASRKVDIFLDPYATGLTTNQSLFTRYIYQNATLFVNYTRIDSTPVLNATISISGHGGLIYTINQEGNGLYSINLNVSSNVTTYNIIIIASKANYEQRSVSFTLIVDEFESILESLGPIIPRTLSENVTLTLFYYEPGNPSTNYTNALFQVSLSLTSNYLTETVDFVYNNALNGCYSIILFTGIGTNFDGAGQYSVFLHASQSFIKNASLKVDIFLDPYVTVLNTNQTLFSTNIYENVTMFVNYTTQPDFSPVIGANISVSGHGGLLFTVIDLGGGIYSIEFNSSITVTTYNILITASKLNYEQKSVSFVLVVDEYESVLENIVPVLPHMLSENITIQVFYYEPGNSLQNYTGATISVSLNATSDYLSESVDYIFSNNFEGLYTVTLFTGDGTRFNETGQYSCYVHANQLHIKNASRKIDIFLNSYTTSLTTNQSLFSANLYENITLYVNYSVLVDSSPVLGAEMNLSGHGALSYSINDFGNGIYGIELNASGVISTYDIVITASKANYEPKSLNFILTVDEFNSVLETMGSINPVTLSENVSILLFYYEPGNPIQNYSNALIEISLGISSGYLVENTDFIYSSYPNGTYSLLLFTGSGTSFNVTGQHSIFVHASQNLVKNASRKADIYLNSYSTSLTTNTSLFLAGFNENITLFVNYTVAFNSNPIASAGINITGQGTLLYTIREEGSGVYSIELNTSSVSQTYNILVTASKPNYELKSVNIILQVEEYDSTLESLVAPSPQTLSENITMTMFYYRPGNPTQNYTNALIQVSRNLTTNYLIENVDFVYQNNLEGTYTVIIFTGDGTQFNQTGQFSLFIYASQLNVKNASRKVDIFLEAYEAVLTSNKTIFLSDMLQNVTFYVNYTVLIDSTPIPSATISIIGQGGLSYTIFEVGNGIYSIELNASSIVNTYNMIVTASKVNYEQKSVNFLLSVDATDSTLENLAPMIPKSLSENITMTLFYYETGDPTSNYTGALIQLSMNLTSDYLIENLDFIITDNNDGSYLIILYTGDGTRFNTTGQNSVYARASKLYIKNASLKIDIFLDPYTAQLTSNHTLFSSRINENVTFFVNYTRGFDSSPITGANINISGQGSLSYAINELGNGVYSIELNSSSIVNTYNIIVTTSKANCEVKSLTFIISVDEFESTLENLDAIAPITLSENVTLRLFYYDPGNPSQNYTVALLEVSMNLSADFLIENVDYLIQNNDDGTYNVTIFTGTGTRFNQTGQYSIYTHASQIYVKNASRKLDLFLNAYATSLTTNQSVFTQGMNENITLYLNYTLLIDSSPIVNANINVSGIGGLVHQAREAGGGIYTIEINTSNVKTSYDILVILSKTNYEQKSQSFILSVSEYNTNLETNHSQIIQAQSNQNITLYVNYTREDGTPIDNANLYVLGITLDYTKYSFGGGIYGVEINVSDVFANYDVILVINKTNFKQKSLSFIISVNVLDSTLEVLQGQSLINFRENLTLLVLYSSPMDQNINYTQATINISSAIDSDYWVENLHYLVTKNPNGTYSLVIFTGESVKINESGQNIFHIHAVQPNVRNATRSYSFFINPIQTEILAVANQTVFEIPKYESINFTVKYQTELGALPLENASIVLYGISNYSIQEISLGLYEIILKGGNKTKSYSISLVATKQNYAAATLDLVLIVRSLDQFTNINVSQAHSTVTVGETTEFAFSFYYEYTGQYLTDQNITVTYQWTYGSGNLTMQNATHFVLEIDTGNVPPFEYQITIYVYDQENNLFAQEQVTLTVFAKPIPPWIYSIVGAAAIGIFILAALVYYNKRVKPKRIFKNKALMDKYSRYLDAYNLQHIIVTFKDSGVRINSRTYGKETEVDDDLISGFITALSSFGTELTGVATAMENIKYKGSKLLLENGNYINTCLVLNEEESPNLKSKALKAIDLFEEKYMSYLKGFTGEVSVFEDSLDIYDDIFEIYLTGSFKINYDLLTQRSKAFNKNKKEIMRIILSRIQKKFTLQELFELIHKFKIKLEDPEIFAELYDLIQMGIFARYIPIESLKYPPKEQ